MVENVRLDMVFMHAGKPGTGETQRREGRGERAENDKWQGAGARMAETGEDGKEGGWPLRHHFKFLKILIFSRKSAKKG